MGQIKNIKLHIVTDIKQLLLLTKRPHLSHKKTSPNNGFQHHEPRQRWTTSPTATTTTTTTTTDTTTSQHTTTATERQRPPCEVSNASTHPEGVGGELNQEHCGYTAEHQ